MDTATDVGAQGTGGVAALRSFSRFLRPYWSRYLLVFVFCVMEMAFQSGLPFSLKFIIDSALLGGNHTLLIQIITGLLVAVVVVSAAGLFRDYLYAGVSSAVLGRVRSEMFEHLQRLSMDFYSRSEVGDILSHFTSDLAVIENAATAAIPWAILPTLDFTAGTVLLFTLDWRLACVAMLVWPATLLGPRWLTPRIDRASHARKEGESGLLVLVGETVTTQPAVKGFGLAGRVTQVFETANTLLTRRMVSVSFFSALLERSATIAVIFLQVIVIGTGAWMVSVKMMTVGQLMAFQALFVNMAWSIGYVTQYVPTLVQAGAGFSRIDAILTERPRVVDRPTGLSAPRMQESLAIDNVTFSYTGEQKNLEGLSLKIPRGSSVAFVGGSGSGKSTVLSLLVRFYDPDEGTVRLDGVDLRELRGDSVRAHMSYVFQEAFLFNTSVRENIRLGRLDATDEEVEAAAKAAEIHEGILGLPQGYDTSVGEHGGRLSGGQRQRIAIARAIVREPEVLLLDEATSALDPGTEAAVVETLEKLGRGRTVIAVTHRLATAVHSDIIFVMDHGHLIEQGSHDDLLAANGAYRRLWAKQSGFNVSATGDSASISPERLREVSIFADMEAPLLAEVARMFSTESRPPDRVITREGDPGDAFYIIVRGKVEVVRAANSGQERRIAVLEHGDYFGEIALLRHVPRTATVRTLTACVFLVIPRTGFMYLLENSPHVKGDLLQLVESRVAQHSYAEPVDLGNPPVAVEP